jgi:hypothetical protein
MEEPMTERSVNAVSSTCGDVEIIAIEETRRSVDLVGTSIVAAATKRPLAVILRSPAGEYVLDLVDDDPDVIQSR